MPQRGALLPQHGAVDQDSVPLHARKDGQERHLNLVEDPGEPLAAHSVDEKRAEPLDKFGVFGRVAGGRVDRHGSERAVLPGNIVVRQRVEPQVRARDRCEIVMPLVRLKEVRGDHRVEPNAAHGHAVAFEDGEVVLEVLSCLLRQFGFQKRAERIEDAGKRKLRRRSERVVRDRDVVADERSRRHGDADDRGRHRIAARRLEIDRYAHRRAKRVDNLCESLLVEDGAVVARCGCSDGEGQRLRLSGRGRNRRSVQ